MLNTRSAPPVQAALGEWIAVAEAPNSEQVAAKLVAEFLGNLPILMDERRGVQCGRSRGLVVIRTPLIYAQAKTFGLISSVKEKLDELRSCGFRLSDQHYDQILTELGER